MSNDDLTLEKLKIDERLREVEHHMAEAKPIREEIAKCLSRLEKSVDGIAEKMDSHEKRLSKIEDAEESRKKSVESIMKVAWGAMTMAVGAAAVWVFKVVKYAIIGH